MRGREGCECVYSQTFTLQDDVIYQLPLLLLQSLGSPHVRPLQEGWQQRSVKAQKYQPASSWRASEHRQLFHYGANNTVETADIAFNNAVFKSLHSSAVCVCVFNLINANVCATTHICILKVQNSIDGQVSSRGRF